MIPLPHIVVKSLATCSRRQEPFLRHLLDEQFIASYGKKTLVGLRVGFVRCEGKEVITTTYRIVGFGIRGNKTVYFAHD